MRSSQKCELECELERGKSKAWNSLLRVGFGFNPASTIRDIKEPKWNFHDLIKILFIFIYFFKFYFIFKLYITVLVLPNIKMNLPQVYMCSPS